MSGDGWRVTTGDSKGTTSSGAQTRTNGNVTRRGLTSVNSGGSSSATRNGSTQHRGAGSGNVGGGNAGNGFTNRGGDRIRVENHNVQVIHPRERDFVSYSDLGRFWGRDPHYFGFRVSALPPRYSRVRHFGIDYFLWNDVYYRPWGSYYVVCRPPFGVVIDHLVDDLVYDAVTFAFYNAAYHAYSGFDSYSSHIDEQNRTIARNNEIIAQQNSQIAMNLSAAQSSCDLAESLGLAQSYAYADKEYYYDDGVFYIINSDGKYQTIVPPAGALVEELPEDFTTITLGGREYYRVDDTVYRVTMIDGHPYMEVLGQMYGTMASKYSLYQ